MNRLQKKCFIASIAAHLLLLAVALFGSALMPAPKAQDFTPITMIDPALLTDGKTSGGNPNAVTPPSQSTQTPVSAPPTPPAAPPPPKTQPEHEETPKPPEPRHPVVARDPEPVVPRDPQGDKPVKPPKPAFTPDELKLVKRSNSKKPKTDDQTDSKAQQDAERRRQDNERRNQIAKQFGTIVRRLDNGLSSSTDVVMPSGSGDGGPAAQNYRDAVASIYTQAWSPPADLEDELATVNVSVTIDREGNVVSAHITKHSGNSSMDQSIQNTLEKVTYIAPFPATAKEQQRTYTIKFNLQAKRSVG